jgi:hypothetical protein
MSRVLLLSLTERQVVTACETEQVRISTIEPLLSGGVRLVCRSGQGAARMTRKLKSHLINGVAVRERHRPSTPLW